MGVFKNSDFLIQGYIRDIICSDINAIFLQKERWIAE